VRYIWTIAELEQAALEPPDVPRRIAFTRRYGGTTGYAPFKPRVCRGWKISKNRC
jgi:hypothetical protein